MPIGVLFWVIMILWLVLGLIGWWPRTQGNYLVWGPVGVHVIAWILLFLLDGGFRFRYSIMGEAMSIDPGRKFLGKRWKCPKCGKMNSPRSTVCKHCGTPKP